MRSILNESDRATIGSRVRSLSASSTARWGRMSVTGTLEHLRLSARMAVGELTVASANKRACQVFPLKHLIRMCFRSPKERRPRLSCVRAHQGLSRKSARRCWHCWT
jgi:hypothetical protein